MATCVEEGFLRQVDRWSDVFPLCNSALEDVRNLTFSDLGILGRQSICASEAGDNQLMSYQLIEICL